MRKFVIALIVLLILGAGVAAGLLLVQREQDIREKAAVPTGEARVTLVPSGATDYEVGQTYKININFNTANIPVSMVAVKLTYPYTGASPEVAATNLTANQDLLAGGEWSCPIRNINTTGGIVTIEVSCINSSAAGFATNTDTLLASFDLNATSIPAVNPVAIVFDTGQSVVTRKSDGTDVLLTPSNGSYTFLAGATASPTASPTVSPTGSGSPSPTATATSQSVSQGGVTFGGTTSPTPTQYLAQATVTPTPIGGFTTSTPIGTAATPTLAPMPVSGVGTPTLVGIAVGIILIIGAVILAL